MITRRAFVAAVAALGVSPGTEHGPTGVRPSPDRGLTPVRPFTGSALKISHLDPWIEVSAQNLRHNVGEVSRASGGRPILAVIKNNGYGLGVTNVGRLLEDDRRIAGFAVIKLQEAVALRDEGLRKPIVLMGPVTDDEITEAAARNIALMVYRDHGAAFTAAAAKTRRPVAVHIKIDTGMGRVGVPYGVAPKLLAALAANRAVAVEGVMTTLTEDEAFDREQVARFNAFTDACARAGIRVGRRHAASSYALFRNPDAFLDMVRPGMALCGIYSEPSFRRLGLMNLVPAVALRCRVALVKQLQAGESAGYNRAFVAMQPTWIATLPVGHADGWPRVAAKGARVRIGGELYPVVASVSASHTLVNLGARATVALGEVATLFDWTEGSRPEDVGEACGASVYDLAMHLHALLPRRVVS